MTRRRPAMALPAALAAIVVLAAIAALASVSALAAIREGSALRDEAQSRALAAGLRARAGHLLERQPLGAILANAFVLGGADTILTVTALAWPWYRATVTAGGVALVSEVLRAVPPAIPWCSGAVFSGAALIAPGTLSLDPGSACSTAAVVTPAPTLVAFDSAMASGLILGPVPDTLSLSATVADPAVWRARRVILVTAGANLKGVLSAPVIHIEPAAAVRGMVFASDTLVTVSGGTLEGDPLAAFAAFRAYAAVHAIGRRGLLLPP